MKQSAKFVSSFPKIIYYHSRQVSSSSHSTTPNQVLSHRPQTKSPPTKKPQSVDNNSSTTQAPADCELFHETLALLIGLQHPENTCGLYANARVVKDREMARNPVCCRGLCVERVRKVAAVYWKTKTRTAKGESGRERKGSTCLTEISRTTSVNETQTATEIKSEKTTSIILTLTLLLVAQILSLRSPRSL